MAQIAPDRLLDVTRRIVAAMGSGAAEAEEVAAHLVRANLVGHDSHGVGMIPSYVEMLQAGLLVPNQTLRVAADLSALLVLDAGRGFGQRMGGEAVRMAIERARRGGACVLALRDSAHIGRIGAYGELAAGAGMAFVGFVNVADHRPWTAPWGGSQARLGTNPFCATVPDLGGTAPAEAKGAALLLDMATSTIAYGKARVARNKGVPVPVGTLLDETGAPTTDPTAIIDEKKGALTAFGQHKGSGLAVMCEALGAALIGAQTITHPCQEGIVNSMLAVVIDPAAFGDAQRLAGEVEAVKTWVRSSPPAPGFTEVLLPGEPEARSHRSRTAEGIPVDPRSLEEILTAAASLGLDRAALAHDLGAV